MYNTLPCIKTLSIFPSVSLLPSLPLSHSISPPSPLLSLSLSLSLSLFFLSLPPSLSLSLSLSLTHSGPTPYDVPVQDFVNGLYHLRVEAEDEFGNIDSQELTFSPPTATFVGCECVLYVY